MAFVPLIIRRRRRNGAASFSSFAPKGPEYMTILYSHKEVALAIGLL